MKWHPLVKGAGGWELGGRVVPVGSHLELRLPRGQGALPVRFELSDGEPVLYFALGTEPRITIVEVQPLDYRLRDELRDDMVRMDERTADEDRALVYPDMQRDWWQTREQARVEAARLNALMSGSQARILLFDPAELRFMRGSR